jgi:hypothetical protein
MDSASWIGIIFGFTLGFLILAGALSGAIK